MVAGLLERLRPPTVLALDLSRPVTDDPSAPPLAKLVRQRGPELRDVLQTIEEAARDRRVEAIVARVDAPAESWAHAQELHAAITAFRASGKPAVANAQSFSEAGNGTLAYLVATAFDEIHLQPTGEVGATGVAMSSPFVAELLERLDLEPQFGHRHEYKTAVNMFTERGFTEAHHEASDRIVESLHEQLVAAVATGRRLPRDRAAELLDRAPVAAEEALEHGLVDRLAYRDETVSAVKGRVGPSAELLPFDRYHQAVQRRGWRPGRPTVALVHGHGGIQVGRSRRGASGPAMGSDTVGLGFSQALRDDKVRAIVFRVESPGGSVVGSDAIARAVTRAREAGKPVVVTMGAIAGSGGYWVAMGADRIVASPGTITGSIGVLYGKLVTSGLLDRVGVATGEVHRGDNALMMSSTRSFTDGQWQQIDAFLDRVYDRFVDEVARGRGLDRDRVHEVAKGRIWTGADAQERGLVDTLGGYTDAFAAARELAGLDPDTRLQVKLLPHLALPEKLGLKAPADDDAAVLLREVRSLARAVRTPRGGRAEVPAWLLDAASPDPRR
jgi:protease-4